MRASRHVWPVTKCIKKRCARFIGFVWRTWHLKRAHLFEFIWLQTKGISAASVYGRPRTLHGSKPGFAAVGPFDLWAHPGCGSPIGWDNVQGFCLCKSSDREAIWQQIRQQPTQPESTKSMQSTISSGEHDGCVETKWTNHWDGPRLL